MENNLKTITFSQNVNNTIPFFRLGENFDLQFDDLYGNEADYFYTIEHYLADILCKTNEGLDFWNQTPDLLEPILDKNNTYSVS